MLVFKPKNLPNFQIYQKHERRGGDTITSYVRYVEVRVFNLTVRMLKNGVLQINGVPSFVPFASQGVNIINAGGSLVLSTNFGLTVTWNGYSQSDVSLCDAYAGLTCGLCGNSDGRIKLHIYYRRYIRNKFNKKVILIMILLIRKTLRYHLLVTVIPNIIDGE